MTRQERTVYPVTLDVMTVATERQNLVAASVAIPGRPGSLKISPLRFALLTIEDGRALTAPSSLLNLHCAGTASH